MLQDEVYTQLKVEAAAEIKDRRLCGSADAGMSRMAVDKHSCMPQHKFRSFNASLTWLHGQAHVMEELGLDALRKAFVYEIHGMPA